jgi:DNA-binding IclR family transcriptional regulator
MSKATSDDNTIQSVDRTFRIVEIIQHHNGASLTEVADAVGLSKSTAYRHLYTLIQHGYVVREGDQYHVGLRFLDPAIHAKTRKQVYRITEPKVEQLAERTGERAQFITHENSRGIHIHSAVGENGIRTESRVGQRVYLHTTSVGKCILAYLPRSDVERIIDRQGLPKLTENTITTREELFANLERIRERGYGFNRAERRNGMMAIGAPILDPQDRVLGGISVTGPQRRMESEHREYLPDLLIDLADEIQLRLEYPQQVM